MQFVILAVVLYAGYRYFIAPKTTYRRQTPLQSNQPSTRAPVQTPPTQSVDSKVQSQKEGMDQLALKEGMNLAGKVIPGLIDGLIGGGDEE